FTAVVASNVIAGALLISVTNGNIGTLVRMRDMVTPMIIVLAGLGASAVGRWATRPIPIARAPALQADAVHALPLATTADSAADRAVIAAGRALPRFSAARRAWIGSRTRALVANSVIGRLLGLLIRAAAAVVVFLWGGRVREAPRPDYSGLVAAAR